MDTRHNAASTSKASSSGRRRGGEYEGSDSDDVDDADGARENANGGVREVFGLTQEDSFTVFFTLVALILGLWKARTRCTC
jgi:hypothetical protein